MSTISDFVFPLAVVEYADNEVIIWHVDLGPIIDASSSRLCGAWVLESTDQDTIDNLTTGRMTTGPGHTTTATGQVDLQATVEAMNADTSLLDEQFSAIAAATKGNLVPPRWRHIDLSAEALVPLPGGAPEHVANVLRTARLWATVADAWAHNETQRLMRPKLAEHAGLEIRRLPVVEH